MKQETRRAVAYIAARVAGSEASAIFDCSGGGYVTFSGTVSRTECNVYDHGCSAHVSGKFPSLYHFGSGAHLDVNIERASGGETSFKGYDYASGRFFEGKVRGKDVELFVFGGGYFTYSI